MLSALLIIGKVIGIFLLVLLLLVFFLLALVLFVPVRYTGKAKKQDKIQASCCVSWLFRIISFCFSYDDGEMVTQLKIFGIPLKRKKKPAKDVEQELEEDIAEGIEASEKSTEASKNSTEAAKVRAAENAGAKEGAEASNMEREEHTFETEHKKNTVWNRILDKIRKIWYTIASICDKILQIKANIEKYLAIWRAPETQEAFTKCKKELVRILCHIKPKKLRAEVTFGMEDPALTGEILGAVSIFYAYIGKNVLIHPDFENVVFRGELSLKGRVRAWTLLLCVGRLYFDKNVKKLIHEFRKERADG